MKTRIYISDRAYREAVYQAIGRHLGDTCPCSTGLIMRGFARPEILFEIDMAIIKSKGTPHQRLQRFHTDEVYKDGQQLGMRFCKSVRAGNVVHLRGQTGVQLGRRVPVPGRPRGPGRPGDEEHRRASGGGRGVSSNDICKIHTFILHRAHREAIYCAIGRHLKGVHPCGTGHDRRRLRPARAPGRDRCRRRDPGLSREGRWVGSSGVISRDRSSLGQSRVGRISAA